MPVAASNPPMYLHLVAIVLLVAVPREGIIIRLIHHSMHSFSIFIESYPFIFNFPLQSFVCSNANLLVNLSGNLSSLRILSATSLLKR